MIEHKFVGFISNKTSFKDNDAIINVLCKDGSKTFKARGINKITSKNASSCNYFMISEFLTSSKTDSSNQTLKSSSIKKMYKKPYEDILCSASYLFICSMLNQLKEQINGYDVAIMCFDKLEEGTYPINVLNYFLKQVVNTLGYTPNLKGCINCNSNNNLISFDFESGGYICSSCYQIGRYEKYSTNFLKDLYKFLKEDDMLLLSENYSIRLFKMYCAFLENVVNLNMESYKFVLKCL